MPTIAIVGAGPQFGLSTARIFGAHDYRVALIARSRDRLVDLSSQLTAQGVEAAGFPADVRDGAALTGALAEAAERFDGIDVLSFSPLPARDYLQPVLQTTPEQAQAAFEFSVLGTMRSVQAVLPAMRERGQGSLLFTSGGSALTPNGNVAGTSISMAGEAAYITMLHEALAPENIYVAHLVVRVGIAAGAQPGDPDDLAAQLWQLHEERTQFRVVVGD